MRTYKPKQKSVSYNRCERLTAILINLGYKRIIFQDLKYLIQRHIGADPRTVKKYVKLLCDFGFIHPNKIFTLFQVNGTFVPKQTQLMAVLKK